MSLNATTSTPQRLSYEIYTCADAYVEIFNRLNGKDIPETFKDGLENLKSAGDKYIVHVFKHDAPDDPDVMKQVIGRRGCYFIRTTQECDLDFIWHDRLNNKIEFWGPKKSIGRAVKVIKSRIRKIQTAQQIETKIEESVEHPSLRFNVGDNIFVLDNNNLLSVEGLPQKGKIVKLWEQGNPYVVQLENGELIDIPQDTPEFIVDKFDHRN